MLTMEECLRETPLRLKDMINTHPDLFKEVAPVSYTHLQNGQGAGQTRHVPAQSDF